MIVDDFCQDDQPFMSLQDFYGDQGHFVDRCLVIFSKQIFDYMLDTFSCKEIGMLTGCNGNNTIFVMNYKNKDIAFYLTDVGSALASSQVAAASWVTGAKKFVMFGSCGCLDSDKVKGKYIVPTEAYRGEGCSYYYLPASDYITIKNSQKVAEILTDLKVPFVQGRVWTTDSMLRETKTLIERRKKEGCIAVEMELAGVEALCDFYGLELYDFLQSGDVLDGKKYIVEGLKEANHDLDKLYIALEIASYI